MQACRRSIAVLPAAQLNTSIHRSLRYSEFQSPAGHTHHIRSILTAARRGASDWSFKKRIKEPRTSSTSSALIDALQLAGHDFALPRRPVKHKVDLSEVAVGTNYGSYLRRRNRNGRFDRTNNAVTIETLIADHIRRGHEEQDQEVEASSEEDHIDTASARSSRSSTSSRDHGQEKDFGAGIDASPEPDIASHDDTVHERRRRFLEARSYTPEDVEQWAGILCEKEPEMAARKMLAYQRLEDGARRLPVPVLLFFLRRQRLDPSALRVCILLAWQEVQRIRSIVMARSGNALHKRDDVTENGVLIDRQTFFVLIVRLLRHARVIWPGALVTITNMFIEYFSILAQTPDGKLKIKAKSWARLSSLHNQVLTLLAVPISYNPFYAVFVQERAQFDLLTSMMQYNPLLNISRKGYHAIVSVQLANKKTNQERDWDNLKARSWPPWKQDKTGLDADKGRDYGTSRALHVLNRAREAGYGFKQWENIAATLAGWNVDGSPAIQTRSFLNEEHVAELNKLSPKVTHVVPNKVDKSSNPNVWAARVRATRTMHEAWACFLDFKDENLRPNVDIYVAMLAKIAAENERLREERLSQRMPTPFLAIPPPPSNAGDSLEVMAPPLSYKEAPFLSKPPPSFHELALEMFSHGLRIRGRVLVFMLVHASNLSEGTGYLLKGVGADYVDHSTLTEAWLEKLLLDPATSEEAFIGYVGLLCRFPFLSRFRAPSTEATEVSQQIEVVLAALHREPPILFALRLLLLRKPRSRVPWYTVLEAAARPRINAILQRRFSSSQPDRFAQPGFVRTILKDMSATGLAQDATTLRNVCSAIEPVVIQAQDVLAAQRTRTIHDKLTSRHQPEMSIQDAAKLLGQIPDYVQSMFNDVMGVGNKRGQTAVVKAAKQHNLPRLLASPRPDMLHAYMRVLGALQDWQGIFNFIDWMVKYEKEVTTASEAAQNGPRLLRRTLVAARVYLQRTWDQKATDDMMAPAKTVKNVKNLIEQVPAWGGWPSTRETADYCQSGRFPGMKSTSDGSDEYV